MNVVADQIGLDLDWSEFTALVTALATRVTDDVPDVVVGVLRGGVIPAVLFAHRWGLRDVRAMEITHTIAEGVNADKKNRPELVNPASLGEVAGLDVLIMDDVAGSGHTVAVAVDLAVVAGARRVRTAVCVVNELNWWPANDRSPHEALSYVGVVCQGWVRFPWEMP
jgi:uncharacterized protein